MIKKIIETTLFYGCVVVLFFSIRSHAQVGQIHQKVNLERAQLAELAASQAWHSLLFYQPRWIQQPTSLVDSPGFFLAENGHRDPEAELKATLDAFALPSSSSESLDDHAVCRYPARLAWLSSKLPELSKTFTAIDCPHYSRWRDYIGGTKVTYVFSSFFSNNPASLFGHSFLRISREKKEGRIHSPLLDPIVHFSAETPRDDLFLYPVKGLMGAYPGRFLVGRYFEKVQEYNNWERRDLWEYDLNLSPQETDKLLQSFWEVAPHPIAYWYLDENCSFMILTLLDNAAPTLNLASRTGLFVLPQDTLRLIKDEPGLVAKVTYRPSLATQFEAHYNELGERGQTAVRQLIRMNGLSSNELEMRWSGWLASLSQESATSVIDTTLDWIALEERLAAQRQPETYGSLYQFLLKKRSASKIPSKQFAVPEGSAPHLGHRSSRVGVGLRDYPDHAGSSALLLNLRPALHDLMSVPTGYHPGLELNFGETNLRYQRNSQRFFLDDFRVFDVLSLNPFNALEKIGSWWLSVGGGEVSPLPQLRDGPTQKFADIKGGFGLTVGDPRGRLFGYVLGLGRARAYGLLPIDAGMDAGLKAATYGRLFAGATLSLIGEEWVSLLGTKPIDPGWRLSGELAAPLSNQWELRITNKNFFSSLDPDVVREWSMRILFYF